MEIADELRCVFSAQVEERDDAYVIEIPKQEVTTGTLQPGEVYRTALLATARDAPTEAESATDTSTDTDTDTGTNTETNAHQKRASSGPPVEEGEVREVDIDDIGEQGDGIARVERGYVIIVPETEKGERVTIEITNVRKNVAFSEVVEREGHFQ